MPSWAKISDTLLFSWLSDYLRISFIFLKWWDFSGGIHFRLLLVPNLCEALKNMISLFFFFTKRFGGQSILWLALPRWLLSWYYMNRASPEPPFLYRDWKQWAKAMCYPLPWFSIGSFTRPPGKHDNLENFQQDRGITILGSKLTWPAQFSCNRKVDFFLLCLTKVPRSLQSEPWAQLM